MWVVSYLAPNRGKRKHEGVISKLLNCNDLPTLSIVEPGAFRVIVLVGRFPVEFLDPRRATRDARKRVAPNARQTRPKCLSRVLDSIAQSAVSTAALTALVGRCEFCLPAACSFIGTSATRVHNVGNCNTINTVRFHPMAFASAEQSRLSCFEILGLSDSCCM